MKRGLSAESPSASRSLLIEVFRLLSKSTNVSAGQMLGRSSSRVTTSPGLVEQDVENAKRLFLQLDPQALLMKFPGA